MAEMTDWRPYPAGVPVTLLIRHGDSAVDGGDLIAAGNWYFHAKRRGSPEATSRIRRLVPDLEVMAREGSAEAMVLIAEVLLGDKSDAGRAASLLESAAEDGVVEGIREFGFILDKGIGVAKDPVRAHGLFLKAADAGDGYAAFNLAVQFYNGSGTVKDDVKFLKWLRIAADLGIPEACAVLGDQCSREGSGTEARQWYEKATESSHIPSMLALAERYRDGIGGPADRILALRWFLAPLDRRNADGIHPAIELARTMTEAEIREAGRLSGHSDEAELFIGS